MGQTRVDLRHLLEDLRDAYPGSLEETILTEIVANSLDSGATSIRLVTDPAQATFTAIDDGAGMRRRELARYHDIAASSKVRGEGIGFAGVGIKLGLLLSEEVRTETRRGTSHVASRWRLVSRQKAEWKWIAPAGRVESHGTAVSLVVGNALSPLLDPGWLESTLRRGFQPLFEGTFEPLLQPRYPRGVHFEVSGALLGPDPLPGGEIARIEVRLPRRRKASALGYLVRAPLPLAEEQRGVAVSTFGKVIQRGWDWLGVTPAAPERIGGLIEVPDLAECLTLNKAGFIRSGARGASYLAFRRALQEAVSRQLAAWGDAREAAEEQRRRVARPIERELERVLVDLADDFPLLAALVERRAGGQRRLPIGAPAGGEHLVPAIAMPGLAADAAAAATALEAAAAASVQPPETRPEAEPPGAPPTPEVHAPGLHGAKGPKQPTRYALSIQFAARPDDEELARLVESTVWVNESHPAYARARASRSEGYHLALAVAMALAPLAVEPRQERGFVTAFMREWGEATGRGKRGRGRG
jgi:hypothetical protein